jgi:hypothetical protein
MGLCNAPADWSRLLQESHLSAFVLGFGTLVEVLRIIELISSIRFREASPSVRSFRISSGLVCATRLFRAIAASRFSRVASPVCLGAKGAAADHAAAAISATTINHPHQGISDGYMRKV